jgi:hypothetical protein
MDPKSAPPPPALRSSCERFDYDRATWDAARQDTVSDTDPPAKVGTWSRNY